MSAPIESVIRNRKAYRAFHAIAGFLCLLGISVGAFPMAYAQTVSVSVTVAILACSDGNDNDSDGLVDYPNDPGCVSALDDNENDPPPPDVSPDRPPASGQRSTGSSSVDLGIVVIPSGELIVIGSAPSYRSVALLRNGIIAMTSPVAADGMFTIHVNNMPAGNAAFSLYGVDAVGMRSPFVSFLLEILSGARTEVRDVLLSAVPSTVVPGEPLVPEADVNTDGRINAFDLAVLSAWYGIEQPPARFDFNGDGRVTLADVSILMFYWTG
jgi:hypothetical protein